jgi:glycosyltransferase involved in cell wall biosynthesis
MKIYYLSQSLVPSSMADSIQVMKMCSAFTECGSDVTLFAIHGAEAPNDIFGYYRVRAPFSIRFDYPEPIRKEKPYFGSRYRWPLFREFRRRPPDLFYGRSILPLLAAADLGRPVVCEVHDLPSESRRFGRLVEHPALARVVVITRALREDLLVAYPRLPSNKVMVCPDAADPPPDGLQPATLRASRPGQLNVCYTGSLYPGKGMEVIAQLPRICAWADFHLVGSTDKDIERWRGALTAFPNVFFYGSQEPRAVAAYVAAADIALAPYQRKVEGHGGAEIGRWMSPMKVFEYMALAKPIAASDLPVLREILDDGVTAVLVPPDDIGAWAHALRTLSLDPDGRRALGERACATFNERFTWLGRSRSILAACRVPSDPRGKFWAPLFRLRNSQPFLKGRSE